VTTRAFPVVAFDVLGTGDSTRPDHEFDMRDQAAAITTALGQVPDLIGRSGPFVAVAHSMGGYVRGDTRHRRNNCFIDER
jgi:pimeloyl-ACP methyl ester carboxylesterase